MGIGIYKCPWYNQYVAPQGYSFYRGTERLGRIVWLSNNEVEGVFVDKDEIDA